MTRNELINISERTLWTFIEAFMASLTVVEITNLNVETLEMALLSGVAAVIATLKNVASTMVNRMKETDE